MKIHRVEKTIQIVSKQGISGPVIFIMVNLMWANTYISGYVMQIR